MAKKEKLEDINVMEGIDFKKNQERINSIKNQNRMRKIEKRIKREQMANRIFYGLIILLIILMLFIIYQKLGRRAYESCLEKGYSELYCERNI